MMGPLHTEIAFLSVVEDWLENSGGTTLIKNAGVARLGVAQSLLSWHLVVRIKYSHQITVCTLHTLQKGCNNYESNTSSLEDFSPWRHEMERLHPQFNHWSIALELELKLLSLLKSFRSDNFSMCKNAVKQLLLCFSPLNHYHYARWLIIHWYELGTIDKTDSNTSKAFQDGCFVKTTTNPFPSIGIDQCHKQLNKIVNVYKGA